MALAVLVAVAVMVGAGVFVAVGVFVWRARRRVRRSRRVGRRARRRVRRPAGIVAVLSASHQNGDRRRVQDVRLGLGNCAVDRVRVGRRIAGHGNQIHHETAVPAGVKGEHGQLTARYYRGTPTSDVGAAEGALPDRRVRSRPIHRTRHRWPGRADRLERSADRSIRQCCNYSCQLPWLSR